MQKIEGNVAKIKRLACNWHTYWLCVCESVCMSVWLGGINPLMIHTHTPIDAHSRWFLMNGHLWHMVWVMDTTASAQKAFAIQNEWRIGWDREPNRGSIMTGVKRKKCWKKVDYISLWQLNRERTRASGNSSSGPCWSLLKLI